LGDDSSREGRCFITWRANMDSGGVPESNQAAIGQITAGSSPLHFCLVRADQFIGHGISTVRELDEHIGVATLGHTPAYKILTAQFVQRSHESGLPHDPCAVFRDHLVARAVRVT